MNVYIVAFDGPRVKDIGLVASSYYGPFHSYEEACDFVSLGEYECEVDETPVVLEVENV
jgi:hypothetical protein